MVWSIQSGYICDYIKVWTNRDICILKQGSVMVASGQMVTSDSPGSIIMKWSNPSSQQAKLKHPKFFFIVAHPCENIFGEWIKGYVKKDKASPKIGRFIPVMILQLCCFCDLHHMPNLHMVHLHRAPSDIMTSIHCIHTFISM